MPLKFGPVIRQSLYNVVITVLEILVVVSDRVAGHGPCNVCDSSRSIGIWKH
jgi:hypothetical protein